MIKLLWMKLKLFWQSRDIFVNMQASVAAYIKLSENKPPAAESI